MSSRRLVITGATMILVLVTTTWLGAAAFPLTAAQGQAPPRDARPGQPRPAGSREAELQKAIDAAPTASVVLYFELAKLQEDRAATPEAEATLQAGRRAFPDHISITQQLAVFYNRLGQFDKAVAMYEDLAAADPSNPSGHHIVATFYEEKVRKDHGLTPAEKGAYILAGIAAADRALTYKPDYVDAMVYKNILLRHQAAIETDSSRRTQLIAEADTLRNRAMQLNKPKATTGELTDVAKRERTLLSDADGQVPVRIGGTIKPPIKTKDVRPVYPPDAMAARIQGVIILETVIDASGRVREATVLRSIPMLDDAALEAVRQWQFTPTLLNGAAVPVIMTVTVNFVLQ